MNNPKPVEVTASSDVSEAENFPPTAALTKRVVRKIDVRILLIMFITYNFNFIDKTILSSAAVFGLKDDAHLVGSQYSWTSSIFYFGYLIAEYPATILVQRLPVGKFLSGITVFWGIVVACTAACTSFGGIAVCRFLLGILEATISPAFVYITATWYTRDEIPSRTGVWFAGNSVGGFIASLAAYGIGHIENPLHPWQWLFIIFGVLTFLWSFVIFLFLPDTINGATFLDSEEKQHAQDRVILAGLGVTDPLTSQWKPSQVKECLQDPKTYFFFAISLLTQIPNGGTNSFGNLVLTAFGFTNMESTLIALPASVIAICTITGTGYLAGRFRNTTVYWLILVVLFPIMGSAIIYSTSAKGVRLFAYYCLQTGPGAIPLALSLISSNYKGVTKKMTITAILFLAYCAGNIAGPQTFKNSEAKSGYPTAFRAIMVCYVLVVAVASALRVYLLRENKRRDGNEGVVLDGDVGNNGKGKDLTDWQTRGFRYRV